MSKQAPRRYKLQLCGPNEPIYIDVIENGPSIAEQVTHWMKSRSSFDGALYELNLKKDWAPEWLLVRVY